MCLRMQVVGYSGYLSGVRVTLTRGMQSREMADSRKLD